MQPRITLSRLWTRFLAFLNFSRPGDFAGCGCVHNTPCREASFDGSRRRGIPTLDFAGGVLTVLVMVVMVAVCLGGCQSTALQDIDRDYVGTYNVSTGQGGMKVRWTPAAVKGQGKPAVGLEIDFKQVVPVMDFQNGTGRSRSLQEVEE